MKIAVVGAGLSGLVVAEQLSQYADVSVFEKSRGYGGRMATKRLEPYCFDHGTQFFTAKSPVFRSWLQPWLARGVVACWHATFAEICGDQVLRYQPWDNHYPHYVGVPGMNELARQVARPLNVQLNTLVKKVSYDQRWQLYSETGLLADGFDVLVLALPPVQAANLLPNDNSLVATLMDTSMLGCFSLLLGFEQLPHQRFDVALVRGLDISWLSLNHTKPGRQSLPSIVVHATNRWANAHLNQPAKEVTAYMLAEATKVLGYDTSKADVQYLHPWKYANIPRVSQKEMFLEHPTQPLLCCGDWNKQGRVEAAFLSGYAVAQRLKQQIGIA